ncbi:MAG: hypothetical protein AB7G28_13505 [Pirellulales bacterium]
MNTLSVSPNAGAEVAIFSSVEQAETAVRRLVEQGFDKEHITVICSDWNKEKYFREFEHQEPAGTFTPQAALTGVAMGALLGGIPVVGAAVVTGSAVLWIAIPAAAGALGLLGGLVGAMSTRGVEKELANYYQQAVSDGEILVAAEDSGSERQKNLAVAARIFSELGARPLSLPEG